MTPVDSAVIADLTRDDGHATDGTPGDCLRACLATILDVPLEAVPHVVQSTRPGAWIAEARRTVAEHTGADLACLVPTFPVYVDEQPRPVIASGPSPRGPWWHCIVVDGRTGELLHDPHPSRAGILEVGDLLAIVPAGDTVTGGPIPGRLELEGPR